MKVRLELNNSGAWKLLARFDAANADDRVDVLTCAERLVDALASVGATGVTLRVSTDESIPRSLTVFDRQRGWWPKKPAELLFIAPVGGA